MKLGTTITTISSVLRANPDEWHTLQELSLSTGAENDLDLLLRLFFLELEGLIDMGNSKAGDYSITIVRWKKDAPVAPVSPKQKLEVMS